MDLAVTPCFPASARLLLLEGGCALQAACVQKRAVQQADLTKHCSQGTRHRLDSICRQTAAWGEQWLHAQQCRLVLLFRGSGLAATHTALLQQQCCCHTPAAHPSQGPLLHSAHACALLSDMFVHPAAPPPRHHRRTLASALRTRLVCGPCHSQPRVAVLHGHRH